MEGGSIRGSGGVPRRGWRGQSPLVPKIFDIFTENRPFRDLRVHDIGKSSQVECLCKTYSERQIKTIGHCEQKRLQ